MLIEPFAHHLTEIYHVFEMVLGVKHEVWVMRVENKNNNQLIKHCL